MQNFNKINPLNQKVILYLSGLEDLFYRSLALFINRRIEVDLKLISVIGKFIKSPQLSSV